MYQFVFSYLILISCRFDVYALSRLSSYHQQYLVCLRGRRGRHAFNAYFPIPVTTGTETKMEEEDVDSTVNRDVNETAEVEYL